MQPSSREFNLPSGERLGPCLCAIDTSPGPDLFDGRVFMAQANGLARCQPCQTSPLARHATSAASDSGGTSRRNIVAKGMSRFEGIGRVAPPQPEVERLSPRVINILGMNPMPYTLNGTNCYLIGTGHERVLLDTGHPPNVDGANPFSPDHELFKANLLRTLASEKCTVSLILVSHLHSDHFGGVDSLLDTLGRHIPVGMLPAPRHTLSLWTMRELRKRGLLETVANGPSPFRADGTFDWQKLMHFRSGGLTDDMMPYWGSAENEDTRSWDLAGRSKSDIQLDYFYMRINFEFYDAWADLSNKKIIARPLRHGEIIRVEGATLRCVFTPGHSENHASFVLDEEHSIFSGDNVLGYGTTQLSELYDYMASLKAMQNYGPERLYPGHGGYIADGKGLLDRYRAHREARENQVFELLGELACWESNDAAATSSLTAMEIAKTLYVNTPPKRLKMAKENIEKILLKFFREGKACCWKSKATVGQTPGGLPKFGYVHYMDEGLCWQLKPVSKREEGEDTRHEKFVKVITLGFDGDEDDGMESLAAMTTEAILRRGSAPTPAARL